MSDKKQQLLEAIRNLREKPKTRFTDGICHHIKGTFKHVTGMELDVWFEANLQDWEYYSGNNIYPIAAPEDSEFYDDADNLEDNANVIYENASLYEGEYGRRRYELLDMIEAWVEEKV